MNAGVNVQALFLLPLDVAKEFALHGDLKHRRESLKVFLHLLWGQESVSISFPLLFVTQIPSCSMMYHISGRFFSETVVHLCQPQHRCFLQSA